MDEQRNYTGSAFWITLIVVVMTVGMSLIPGFQVGRASVKRVNILSDLIRQEEHPRLEEADLYFDTTFLAEGRAIEAAAAADSLAADSAGGRQAAEPEIRELVWDLPGYRPMPGTIAPGTRERESIRRRSLRSRISAARFRPWSISTVRCSKRIAGGPSGSPFSATRSSRAIS